ncbi:hypothetical protein [Staphylococcus xylosus]|uniref:hypothetical protein n=1 Tax=Staphylococcus TaxID=1279 RepID=UPI0003FAD7B3|nr:hypothetical protein [Staphylococcus xylosus]MBF0811542.1 hypothetical protein [Staphylococcus xylosus]MBO3074762.1 hypothetical protein [Staphylococcus xylosus]MBU6133183.1 hypothetical protein [Staphylococcus xylosus]MBV5140493.1 hypothetical protein [Staphylococcus xylosus]MCD8784244.1 hypothetical protein [Staphylococcus xylosus]
MTKDNTNIVIAIKILKVNKNTIPITKNILDIIADIFIIFGLIRLPLLALINKLNKTLIIEIVSHLIIFQYVILKTITARQSKEI